MVLGLLMAGLFGGCAQPASQGQASAAQGQPAVRQMTAEQAKELMGKEDDFILVDVRTQEEYDEGHIPGAILIPNETIGDTEIELLPNKDQLILVYCRSGVRSSQAAAKLAKLGYTQIVDMGGIINWPYEIER